MGFTEKFIINSIWQFDYDNDKPYDAHYIKVGSIDGKYGIIDSENNILLPFEYDNITRLNLEVLQVCKSGKLGLVHIVSSCGVLDYLMTKTDRGRFSISNVVEPNFDNVVFVKESLILVMNYHHIGQKIYAYFVYADKMVGGFSDYAIENEEECLINLYGGGMVHLYDYTSGEMLRKNYGSIDKEVSI